MRAARSGSWPVWLYDNYAPEFLGNRDNDPILNNTCESRIKKKKEHDPEKILPFSESLRSLQFLLSVLRRCDSINVALFDVSYSGLPSSQGRLDHNERAKKSSFSGSQGGSHRIIGEHTQTLGRPVVSFYWAMGLDTAKRHPATNDIVPR